MRSQWPSSNQGYNQYNNPSVGGHATFSSVGQPAVQVQINTGRAAYINPVKYPLYFNRWRALFLVVWVRLTINLFSMGPFLLWIMNLQMKNVLPFRFHWFLWLSHVMVHLVSVVVGFFGHKNQHVNWMYAFFPFYIAYFALRLTEFTMIFQVDIVTKMFEYILSNSATLAPRDRDVVNQLVNIYMSFASAVYIMMAIDAGIVLVAAGLYAHKLRQIVRNF